MLRTVFRTDGEQPCQVILPALTLGLERIDLQAVPAEQRDAELAHQVARVTARPFDLINGPLLRASLFQLDVEDFVLVVCMHHIVSDGWSMDVMVKEFAQSYQAYSQGAEPALAELPLQYADYAIWQRSWLEAGPSRPLPSSPHWLPIAALTLLTRLGVHFGKAFSMASARLAKAARSTSSTMVMPRLLSTWMLES